MEDFPEAPGITFQTEVHYTTLASYINVKQ